MKSYGAIFLMIPILVSCSTNVPNCTDEVTRDEVLKHIQSDVEIITTSGLYVSTMQAMVEQLSNLTAKNLELSKEFDKVTYGLENAKESSFANERDVYTCSAALTSSYNGSKESIDIKYTSQLTQQGKFEVVINKISMADYGNLLSVLVREISDKGISEINRLRSEIGDSNIPKFIETNCSGFEMNEKKCSLGRKAAVYIKHEKDEYDRERSAFFKSNPKSLREVYNKCGDTYYKAAGLIRDGRMLDASEIMKISEARFQLAKADEKFYQDCKLAEVAAIQLNVEDAFYFKPESKGSYDAQDNSHKGLEEQEEIDNSQEAFLH